MPPTSPKQELRVNSSADGASSGQTPASRTAGRRRHDPDGRRLDRMLGARRPVRQRRWAATAVTVMYVLGVTPFTAAAEFVRPVGAAEILTAVSLRALFAVLVWSATWFVVRWGQSLRMRSTRHRLWLQGSLVYLGVNAVLLLVVYPGYWVFDEYYTLQSAQGLSLEPWQGFLTNVFYSCALLLAATPMAIIGIQIVVIAVIAGYVWSWSLTLLRHRALALLLAVPLLSPPVLLNNLYPLRLTLYAYLLVLLLARIALWIEFGEGGRRPRASLIGIGVLIAVLAFWRSEGVYTLLMLPIGVVLAVRAVPRGRRLRLLSPAVAVVAVVVVLTGVVTSATSPPKYQLTAMINPLSTMLQEPVTSPHLSDDMAAFGQVLDLKILAKYPQYVESGAFWAGAVRPGFQPHESRFVLSFVDLVVHNPGPYLSNRWSAFAAANSMSPWWLPQVHNEQIFRTDPLVDAARAEFEHDNAFVDELAPAVKYPVERRLLMWEPGRGISDAGRIVWNVLPVVIGLIALLVVAAVRRRWSVTLCSLVLLVHTGLVFLTEPSAYFMYYVPVYLAGGLLGAVVLALRIDSRIGLRTRKQRFAQAPGR